MTAPVCPVTRNQVVWMPGAKQPAVPRAMDLPSLLQAVNSLKRVLQDTIGPGLAGGFTSPNMGPPIVADRPNWFETDRDTRNLRVYHKDADGKQDKSMYIDVVRIDKIVFQYLYDDPYGETFDWQYKR